MRVEVCVKKRIVPDRLIFKNCVMKITTIYKKFIVNKYRIQFTHDNRVSRIFLDTVHPNCDPRTKVFCIPEELKNGKFDIAIIPFTENLIRTFNLDDCYFQPWNEFEYE